MRNRLFFSGALTLVAWLAAACPPAAAAEKISFIRDAEIETTLRTYATPIFQAAGLDPSGINIYIVRDNTLNAFVAGGQKLFINTGLLTRAANANQIVGVIAHETGHIAGGHLARTQDALRNASAASILSMVLAGAATVATGRSDVGAAVMAGGQQMGVRTFLQYSRTQEGAADQAALAFLDASGQSARGLMEFLGVLEDQELLSIGRQDPYVRSHPVTRERIDGVRAHVEKSRFRDKPTPPELDEMDRRMRAKLYAFLEPFTYTLRRYKESDTSLEARYARAVAYYRKPDIDKGLSLIDGLIAEHPEDPYFHELRGQMLYENGRAAEALPSYQKAADLAPGTGLIVADLAKVQLATEDPGLLPAAIDNLRQSLQRDADSPATWHQLAIAYGRAGQMGQSYLALAEEAILRGDDKAARYHAGRAERELPRGSPGWLKAQDILRAAAPKKE